MVVAVVLIGGVGSRLNKSNPKQFIEVNNKPLFLYSVLAFEKNPFVDKILIVCVKEYVSYLKTSLNGVSKLLDIIPGNVSRQLSSFEALKYLKSKNFGKNDYVLLHDGARPNIDDFLINQLIDSVKTNLGVRPILPLEEVIYDDGSLSIMINNKQYIVQTPQAFNFQTIFESHQSLFELGITDLKDDISCLLYFDIPVFDVVGNKLNFKITSQKNLDDFEKMRL